jgi:predicted PurR-regulated permease PerM
VVVGSIDNFLRPILVGRDTQMHELMILFGTLGGIIMFGVVGVIIGFGVVGVVIGPIIAALFVTVWDIYGLAFKDVLPAVAASGSDSTPENSSAEILPNDFDSEKKPPPE